MRDGETVQCGVKGRILREISWAERDVEVPLPAIIIIIDDRGQATDAVLTNHVDEVLKLSDGADHCRIGEGSPEGVGVRHVVRPQGYHEADVAVVVRDVT